MERDRRGGTSAAASREALTSVLAAPRTSGDRRVEVARAVAEAASVYAAAERQLASLVVTTANRVRLGGLQPGMARRRLRRTGAVILAAAADMARRDLEQAGPGLRADAVDAALSDLAAASIEQATSGVSTRDLAALLPVTWTALLGRLDDAGRTALASASAALTDALVPAKGQQGGTGSRGGSGPWSDAWEPPDQGVTSTRAAALAAGLVAYTDTAGRNWHLGTYARAAVFAAATKMYLGTQFATYASSGASLVVVVGPVDGACIKCEPWIGAILSQDDSYAGPVQVTGTIGDAITAGIGHPACRHGFEPLSGF